LLEKQDARHKGADLYRSAELHSAEATHAPSFMIPQHDLRIIKNLHENAKNLPLLHHSVWLDAREPHVPANSRH
jgi:hypothetical protein